MFTWLGRILLALLDNCNESYNEFSLGGKGTDSSRKEPEISHHALKGKCTLKGLSNDDTSSIQSTMHCLANCLKPFSFVGSVMKGNIALNKELN